MKMGRIVMLAMLAAAFSAHAQDAVRMPHGVDLTRLKKIDAQAEKGDDKEKGAGASHKMAVFMQMTAIDAKNANLLFPSTVGNGFGTKEQLEQKFETAISETGRFAAKSQRQTDVMDGIVVEGMITSAQQNLEDYRAFLKSVTTVRMSVAIKDFSTGDIIQSKNLTSVYGSEEGEGTQINRNDIVKGRCVDSVACLNLEGDYDKALNELLQSLAAYIERTFRPIAKVYDITGDTITMFGGTEYGFNTEEQLVIFRAKPKMSASGKPLPPVTIPIAMAQCSVGNRSMTCQVIKNGTSGAVQEGDYAIPTSLKIKDPGEK